MQTRLELGFVRAQFGELCAVRQVGPQELVLAGSLVELLKDIDPVEAVETEGQVNRGTARHGRRVRLTARYVEGIARRKRQLLGRRVGDVVLCILRFLDR